MGKSKDFRSCLREYDIRGLVDQTLNATDAWHIGRAFGTIVRQEGGRRLAIAYDGRLTSPKLVKALETGALKSGCLIQNLGCGPTPMLYYGTEKLSCDGGIMVTGSHNPPQYNGFKIVLHGKPFFGEQILALGERIEREDYCPPEKGEVEDSRKIQEAYVQRLLRDKERITSSFKVVWDAGNGAAGDIIEEMIKKLPGQHIAINTQIDGHFPNHHPDPTQPANLKQLIEAVKREKADLGFAFDGDADRIGVIDETGDVLFGDEILLFLARDVLAEHQGATIISDVKASQILFDGIQKLGGHPLMWKTGHSLIKTKMMETGSPLAGEMSGHIFYADRWYGFDDALYAALRMLESLSSYGKPLSSYKAALPHVEHTPELRFSCDNHKKFTIIENIAQKLRKKGADICEIDGVRVRTKEGWWLLRASNTQAVIVARAESPTKMGLQKLKDEIAHYLQEEQLDVDVPF